MTEPASPSTTTCPWCSAAVPAGRSTCPACGAALVDAGDPAVPGLTAIDAEAVLRNVRATTSPPRRSRILSLITGEVPDEPDTVAGTPAALAPPPPEVRREMLRMELAAEISNLNAEADAIAADEAVETGAPLVPSTAAVDDEEVRAEGVAVNDDASEPEPAPDAPEASAEHGGA